MVPKDVARGLARGSDSVDRLRPSSLKSPPLVASIDDNHSRSTPVFWLNHAIEAVSRHLDMESNKDLGGRGRRRTDG
jgi:hypothetical protein